MINDDKSFQWVRVFFPQDVFSFQEININQVGFTTFYREKKKVLATFFFSSDIIPLTFYKVRAYHYFYITPICSIANEKCYSLNTSCLPTIGTKVPAVSSANEIYLLAVWVVN